MSEEQNSSPIVPPVESPSTWAVSLCFWLSLTSAAVTYGAVALAPKFSMWSDARAEYTRNGSQLSDLEDRIDYLERVKVTLETDPEFLRRLSQSNNPQETASGQKDAIPVSGNLLFGVSHDKPLSAPVGVSTAPSRKLGLAFQLATNLRLRTGLLTFAAALTIFSFAVLNDAGANFVNLSGRGLKAVLKAPLSRYVSGPAPACDNE